MGERGKRGALALVLLALGVALGVDGSGSCAEPAVLYGAPISLEASRKVAAAAVAEAGKNDWTVAVAVVDSGGALVYFERVDGTQTGSVELALEKARTAVAFKRSTKLLEERVVAGRMQYLRQTGAIPIEGGMPLFQDGKLVGAVGVSGVRSEQDGVCAKAGAEALQPAPAPVK